MSNERPAANRQRSKALTAGAIPVAAVLAAAASMLGGSAQAAAPDHTTLGGSLPDWATAGNDRGAVPAAQQIKTRVFLTGQDQAGLAVAAKAVSDPNSPQHGRFLTPDQVKAKFGPTADQVAKVTAWLRGSGLSVSHTTNDWLDATGDAAAVRKAFGTQLHEYQLPDGSTHYAPQSAAQLPIDVASSVTGVSGLFDQPKRNAVHSVKAGDVAKKGGGIDNSQTPSCSAYWDQKATTQFPMGAAGGPIPIDVCGYTPKQLRDAYGVSQSHLTGKGATIAIIDWFASPTMLADANTFAKAHGDQPFAANQYREVVDPSKWQHQTECGGTAGVAGEESLDVEMAHGLAPDANVVYVGANSCYDEDLMAAEAYVVDNHAADVVSNSWGGLMHTTDQGDEDPAVMAAYDRIFQKGALEGIGFAFSSGDCGDDDPANAAGGGYNCAGDSARKQTEWPTSSAWVTSVGGTTLATDKKGKYSWEVSMGDHVDFAYPGDPAWTPSPAPFVFGGGGGTSEDVAQPWYQQWAVPRSMSGTLMNGGAAKQAMRTIPDVAMNGSLATSVLVGQTDPTTGRYAEGGVGGTSVASPEFAAIQADAKQAAHGHAVGFANPALYARYGTKAFNDVTDHPLFQPATIDTVYTYISSATHKFKGALYTVGQDSSLAAKYGYDEATGVGSPTADYLRSFK
jgi:subtilase family serine protease